MVTQQLSSSSSSSFSTVQQSAQQQQQDQQQQLYYAQLLAAQQQAIISSATASASSSSSSNSSDGGGVGAGIAGGGGDDHSDELKKISDRERKEREWSERNTNLIVNYVPQNMTQEEVRALFASIGEVESCKLIRDKATGQSLGYAFVNYERPEDAQKALVSMNGLRIQNKTLKVSLSRPSKDDIKGANLYVSGLPKSVTQPELEAVFRPFGAIITSRILYDNVTGLSKGVGFVRFDRKAEANVAIEKMSGTSPWGGDETISVKFANSPSTNTAKAGGNNSNNNQMSVAAIQQMAQSLLPLQMLQQSTPAVGGTTLAAAAAAQQLSSLPSLLQSPLSAVVAAVHQPATAAAAVLQQQQQQSAGGGPIHAHTPQHRFRYSPLAGVPLIRSSAPICPNVSAPTAALSTLSAMNPSLVSTMAAPPTATSAQTNLATQLPSVNQEYLALLQQHLLQQQLSAYGAVGIPNFATVTAANQSCLNTTAAAQQQQQQQQYAAYTAAALGGFGANGATAAATMPGQYDLSLMGGQQQSKSPAGTFTLTVCNLAPESEDATLWKLFGPFGAVLSVKMVTGAGIGVVTMANYEDAVAAINGLNGSQLGGRKLQVMLSSSQTAGGGTAAGTCLPSLLR